MSRIAITVIVAGKDICSPLGVDDYVRAAYGWRFHMSVKSSTEAARAVALAQRRCMEDTGMDPRGRLVLYNEL